MSQPLSSYSYLLQKLDSFIRKYYTNKLLRGAIFSAVYVLAFFLAINLLEYYFYLPTYLRKVLFFGFIFSSIAFIGRFVGAPLLHYYKLGKLISYEQAAQIIGTHFIEVKDKLLNILQLKHAAETAAESTLLFAAIDQKAVELKPIDFSFAIDLNKNRKYLKYLAPPLFLFLFIIIAAPNVIKESSKRLYHNDTYFEKEAPFKFVLLNHSLRALQFENFSVSVKTEGDARPSEMYVEAGKQIFKMKKNEAGIFVHEFVNLQANTSIRFSANGFFSKPYQIDIVAKPIIASFDVVCDYPTYTGKADEVVKNMGDMVIPAGTKLTWRFNTQNVERLKLQFSDSIYSPKQSGTDLFIFSKSFTQSANYLLKVANATVTNPDSSAYSLNVIPDLYPVIAINEKNDSATQKYFYYLGEIADDYGLRRLTFNYQVENKDSARASIIKTIDVPFAAGLASRFTYYWSLSELSVKPGDKVTYYFEVFDNDGVNGSKSSRSNMMVFEMPSLNELNKEITKDNKELKADLKETMAKAKELKTELKDMQNKLMEKQNMNWEDKKKLENTLDKQKALEQRLKDIQEKLNQNFEKQNEFKELSENVMEKQKNLQELMNKTMDDEMRKLMEKLEKMLENLQKKDALDKMEDMEMSNDKLEKELDRMLELFKKLEFNQKLEETAKRLEDLAKKQEDLAKEQAKNPEGKDTPEQKAAQEKLKEELKEAKKDLAELKKLNEETKNEQDFKDIEKNLDNAEQQMDDAQKSQDQKQNNKASQSQKSAANNMKDAAQKLSDMKSGMEEEQAAEDMQAIRQLLENIVQLSFDEEKLLKEVKVTNINNPRFVELMKEQQRIRENSKMVEDSLYALAKRQEQIKSFITKEISSVNKYLTKSIDDMEDRNVVKAAANQQFIMTGYNNLALMLSEALQSMQQQMSESQKPSSGQPKNCMKCKKPGKGMPNLSKMQQQLKDKMEKMGEMMKKEGEGKKPGQMGAGSSKEFAEMAQMQQQIRKELERLSKEQGKDGKAPGGGVGEAIKQMEETEKNLVNKQLTAEMMKRQQDILNKLLEAENAEREREQQPERESQSGKERDRKLPPSLEEYLKAKQGENDWYKTVPPSLKPYYKTLTEKYFRNVTVPTP